MHSEKIEAICLTLGADFLKNVYPGGEAAVRRALECMNYSDRNKWMQFCGSGLPTKNVTYCYMVWHGKVQYRCDIKEFQGAVSGGFNDGNVLRTFNNRNLCVLHGPCIKAPHDIPMKGFQGFRYSPFLF